MKRLLISILTMGFCLALAAPAISGGAQSSGEITSDQAVVATAGWLTAVQITPNGGAGTVILYDNASAASGTVIYRGSVADGNTYPGGRNFDHPVKFNNGIYADVGATARCIVEYTTSPPK
jgi:hypothetical protein